jgi:LuxR family transcriptional activator of bioluminescence operon
VDILHKLGQGLENSNSVDDIKLICEEFCASHGFEFYLFGVCDAGSLSAPKVSIITNYPDEWMNFYSVEKMQKNDPVVKYCWANTMPIRWLDLMNLRDYVNVPGEQVLIRAREFGLQDGLSVPIKSPSGEIALFSVATSNIEDLNDRMLKLLHPAQSFGNAVFEHYMRVQLKPEDRNFYLTDREKECLFWVCEGKTAWEISKILGVAERTITFHLTGAMKKMGAVNRQHAAAKAIMHGLIQPQV